MTTEKRYSFEEIKKRLDAQDFPYEGITELGSTHFKFIKPAYYAASAIHAGNRIRNNLHDNLLIKVKDRYREEDPGTDRFLRTFPIQITERYSRFEYDVNRDEHRAVYLTPDMAWNLDIWKRPLTDEEIKESLTKYQEFHDFMDILIEYLLKQNDFGIIFDLHSYNYQREKREPWYMNGKPDINIGTEPVNDSMFREMIDDLLYRLSKISIEGHQISVAENDVFTGGYVSRRLSRKHPNHLLVLATEFKKIFMDEWSGEIFELILEELIEKFSGAVNECIDKIDRTY